MYDFLATAREAMLANDLRGRGISDPAVLDAMREIPREQFLPPAEVDAAYDDRALPIDCGQTISQPYIVALMTEALELSPGQRVLEIGTGSGYQAAVLARLGAEVYTIERFPLLARQAADRLRLLGLSQAVHVQEGDGALGWPDAAPFDRIILTAAGESIPDPLWSQLAEGGILVAPLGPPSEQVLMQIRKTAGQPRYHPLTPCRFVPLLPGLAGPPSDT